MRNFVMFFFFFGWHFANGPISQKRFSGYTLKQGLNIVTALANNNQCVFLFFFINLCSR